MNKYFIAGALLIGLIVAGFYVVDHRSKSEESAKRLISQKTQVDVAALGHAEEIANVKVDLNTESNLNIDN